MLAFGLLLVFSGFWSAAAELETPKEFTIDDGGFRRVFVLSNDELYWNGRVQKLDSPLVSPALQANVVKTARELAKNTGQPVQLVLHEKGSPPSFENRRILTRKVLVEVDEHSDPAFLAEQFEIKSWKPVSYARGFFIFETDTPDGAIMLADAGRGRPGVLYAEPLLGKRRSKRSIPDDPLFSTQWYLSDGGRLDLNLKSVWAKYRGKGMTIGIVDDGLEFGHPDLASAAQNGFHYDFRDDDSDASPTGREDYHGTAVAGIVGARARNGIGIAGVAYESSLIAVRLIGGDDQTDEQDSLALLHRNQDIQVSNNSWGAPDNGQTLDGPGTLTTLALRSGVEEGRGGKGTIFVWSAGNGGEAQDNANYDGYANSIFTIAVGGVTDQGKQASFSEPGACLVVSAPASVEVGSKRQGITTTDLTGDAGINFTGLFGDLEDRDYTQLFGGTSAAAPMVSGVVALMLQANPNLGWRDVPEILMRTARKISSDDPDWVVNGAGFQFNHKFGAGLIDAAAAVDLAEKWNNLEPRTRLSFDQNDLTVIIPDEDVSGAIRTFEVPPLRVEQVVLTVTATHARRGDLSIDLISPSGTTSRLAERHLDTNADYKQWRFTSVFHWGESAAGTWKVRIADRRANRLGTLNGLRLELFGTPVPAELSFASISGSGIKLLLTSYSTSRYEVQSSTDLLHWVGIVQTDVQSGESVEIPVSRSSTTPAQFYRAVRVPTR